MNNIKFVNSSWDLISDLKNEYLCSLTNYPDGFWDDLLWEADIYACVINLCKIAKKKGLIPASGCWYYNHASYAALKRSGFLPTSRLFYVKFYNNGQ